MQTLKVFYENVPEKFRHKIDIVVEDETGLYQRVHELYQRNNLSFEDFQRGIKDLHNEVWNQRNDLPPTRLTGRATVCISSLVASQLGPYLISFEKLLANSKFKKRHEEDVDSVIKLSVALYSRHLITLAVRAQVVYFADTVSNKNFKRTLIIPMSKGHSVVNQAMQKARRNFTEDERAKVFAEYAIEKFYLNGKNVATGSSVDSTPLVKHCLQFFDSTISSRNWIWPKCAEPPKNEGDENTFSLTSDRYVEQGVLEYILKCQDPKDLKEGKDPKVETKVKKKDGGSAGAPSTEGSETDISTKADGKESANHSKAEETEDEADVDASATQKKKKMEGSTTLSDEEAAKRAKHLEAVALLD